MKYQTEGSSGADINACISSKTISIAPNKWAKIPAGIFLEIPYGYEGQIRARSGLAFNHGIMLLNSIGTIDSDYRGELNVLLYNAGTSSFLINHGDRIAQISFARTYRAFPTLESADLSLTRRGANGFGSTGV